ncbi:hypothetical protein GCM10011575_24480 [Microlunatus endophyticus]|uniref:Uncharacterized protein n=1 Tax=Microlunatus endophyticus TaxID=1716077 RepID=A0A917SAQ3_9ACTN|nr:hypothetical protein GCM10011575_24480 [Microlunatus endophyticus]
MEVTCRASPSPAAPESNHQSGVELESFDDELQASYRAESTKDGGVAVYVDVYRGVDVLSTIPVTQLGPD